MIINVLDFIAEMQRFSAQKRNYWLRESEPDLAKAGNLMSNEHRQKMFELFPVLYHACPVGYRDNIERGEIVLGFSSDFRKNEDKDEALSTSTHKRLSYAPAHRVVVSQFSVEEEFYIFCLSRTRGIASARRRWSQREVDLYEVNTELFLSSFMRQAKMVQVENLNDLEKRRASQGRAYIEVRSNPVVYCPRDHTGRVEEKDAYFDKSDAWAHEHEVRIALGLFGDKIEQRANGDVAFKTLRNAKVTMRVPPECFKRL